MNELQKKILAILFASGDPIGPERIAEAVGVTTEDAQKIIETIRDRLEDLSLPFEVLMLGGQYQLATRRQYADVITAALDSRRSAPLTQASLEVLAIVAYNQPVTRAFIEQVRGVDSSSIVTGLSSKGLICEVDRLDIPGRPIAFGTTAHFLRTFGISSLSQLPDPGRFAAQAARDAQKDGEEQYEQLDFDN